MAWRTTYSIAETRLLAKANVKKNHLKGYISKTFKHFWIYYDWGTFSINTLFSQAYLQGASTGSFREHSQILIEGLSLAFCTFSLWWTAQSVTQQFWKTHTRISFEASVHTTTRLKCIGLEFENLPLHAPSWQKMMPLSGFSPLLWREISCHWWSRLLTSITSMLVLAFCAHLRMI